MAYSFSRVSQLSIACSKPLHFVVQVNRRLHEDMTTKRRKSEIMSRCGIQGGLREGFFFRYRLTDRYKAKQQQKQDVKNATPPAVKQRKRTLSISEHLKKNQKVKDQSRSALWKLPTELRHQIYQEVIGRRQPIHVALIDGALRSYRCQRLPRDSGHTGCWYGPHIPTGRPLPWHKPREIGFLGLLQSCRTMCV